MANSPNFPICQHVRLAAASTAAFLLVGDIENGHCTEDDGRDSKHQYGHPKRPLDIDAAGLTAEFLLCPGRARLLLSRTRLGNEVVWIGWEAGNPALLRLV